MIHPLWLFVVAVVALPVGAVIGWSAAIYGVKAMIDDKRLIKNSPKANQ